MYEVQFIATTSADWAQAVEIIDGDTNEPMDLTGATFELEVSDCGRELNASTAAGTITTPQAGVVQWRFTESQLRPLDRGRTYRVGLTMTTDGGTIQIFTGTLAMIDGVV